MADKILRPKSISVLFIYLLLFDIRDIKYIRVRSFSW